MMTKHFQIKSFRNLINLEMTSAKCWEAPKQFWGKQR